MEKMEVDGESVSQQQQVSEELELQIEEYFRTFSKNQLKVLLEAGLLSYLQKPVVIKMMNLNKKPGRKRGSRNLGISHEILLDDSLSKREKRKLAAALHRHQKETGEDYSAESLLWQGNEQSEPVSHDEQKRRKKNTDSGSKPITKVNVQSLRTGESRLHRAVQKANAASVRKLLDQGADVTLRTHNGYTALHEAYDCKIAEMLLQAGADVNAVNPNNGNTPLHEAILFGNIEGAQLFLKYHADPTIANCEGMTALDIARRNPSYWQSILQ